MSDISYQMQTDQFSAQNRQFYDSQRYAADRMTAQTIGEIPLQMMRARQLESNLRLQEATIEQQFHRNKMDSMMMLNQVDLSREAARSAKLQNDEIEQRLRTSERDQYRNSQELRRAHNLQALDRLGSYGKTISEDGLSIVDMDEEQKRAWRERNSGNEDRLGRAEYRQTYKALQDTYFSPYKKNEYIGPPEKRDAIIRRMRELEQQFSGIDLDATEEEGIPDPAGIDRQIAPPGVESPQGTTGGRTGTDGDGPGFEITPEVDAMARASAQILMQDNAWKSALEGMEPQNRDWMLFALGKYADDLVAGGQTNPRMAPGFAIHALNGRNYNTAYLFTLAGLKPEKIRSILVARGTSEQAADQILQDLERRASR